MLALVMFALIVGVVGGFPSLSVGEIIAIGIAIGIATGKTLLKPS